MSFIWCEGICGAYALDDDGQLYVWGDGGEGSIGLGNPCSIIEYNRYQEDCEDNGGVWDASHDDEAAVSKPVNLNQLSGSVITNPVSQIISIGDMGGEGVSAVFAVDSAGYVYAWGGEKEYFGVSPCSIEVISVYDYDGEQNCLDAGGTWDQSKYLNEDDYSSIIINKSRTGDLGPAGYQVLFGGVASPSVTTVNAHTLKAIAPARPDGKVDVVVSDGTTISTLSQAFTYYDPMTIESICQAGTGPTATVPNDPACKPYASVRGINEVVITGTNFAEQAVGALSVKVGALLCTIPFGQTSVIVDSQTIRCVIVFPDTNGDGVFDLDDAEYCFRIAAGLAPYTPLCDYDQDGWITSADGMLIARLTFGLVETDGLREVVVSDDGNNVTMPAAWIDDAGSTVGYAAIANIASGFYFIDYINLVIDHDVVQLGGPGGLTPVFDGVFGSATNTAFVATNSPTGYSLGLSTSQPSGSHASDMVHQSLPDNYLLATSNTCTWNTGNKTFTNTTTALSNNTYGFTLTSANLSDQKLCKIPNSTSPLTVKSTAAANETGDDTVIYYGARINLEQLAGEYKTTVVYTALANP
jgi:hypothetical protein